MEMKSNDDDEQEIRRLISGMSKTWLSGDANGLNQYFHEQMAIRGPDLQLLGTGKQTCVKSYEDFINQTTVLDYEESEPEIDLYSETAVVVCPWKIAYELKGQKYREKGRDLLVLVRNGRGWLVAWRAVFPQPES